MRATVHPPTRPRRFRLAALVVAAVVSATSLVGGSPAAAASATITVYAGGGTDDVGSVFANILGANHRYTFNGYDTWDPATGQVRPDVVAKTRQMGMRVLRWPGGTVGNTVWWKGTIGTNRMCQRDGRITDLGEVGNPADDVMPARDPAYGLDEHLAFVAAVGAEAQIMVPMAISNAIDAADLVEYLNTPAGDGVNPNDGPDWAEVRAANGHPAPYGVRFFELGNENYHANQRYWMTQNQTDVNPPARAAITQYINGGSRRLTGERLGKLTLRDAAGNRTCTGSTAGVASDGTPGQVFNFRYPSAAVDTFALRVDGVTWRRVENLAAAGPADRVFLLRPHIGEVQFGDGTHGAIPPAGAAVVADYTSEHRGFVHFYQRMKAVDPAIDVCAAWGRANFPALFAELAPAGSRYDCLTAHPYTHFSGGGKADWDSALEAHDWHMMSAWDERESVAQLRQAVNANTSAPYPYIAISEYGALWGPEVGNPFPEYAYSMTHVLYMASQWIHWLELGIPWAEGNDFVSHAWYTLLGPAGSGFLRSAEAVTREAVTPMFAARGKRIRHTVTSNPLRDPPDAVMCDGGAPTSCTGTYEKLNVTATRAPDGTVYLMVVNRSPVEGDAITADVVLHGLVGSGTATVRRVAPSHFTSHNDVATPSAVTLSEWQRPVAANGFAETFPPYSVTLVRLPPAAQS